jgi:hypothetical protein
MKSSIDKLEDKKIKIDLNKKKLLEKISFAKVNLTLNLENINELMKKYINFINFIKTIKVIEVYYLEELKSNYYKLKKKINKEKKIYKQIVRIYSEISNYFSDEEKDKLILLIKEIDVNNNLIVVNFFLLKKKHVDILNKCNQLVKNNLFIKIIKYYENYEPFFIKLRENYYKIKNINMQIKNIKNKKSFVLNEIQELTKIFIIKNIV